MNSDFRISIGNLEVGAKQFVLGDFPLILAVSSVKVASGLS